MRLDARPRKARAWSCRRLVNTAARFKSARLPTTSSSTRRRIRDRAIDRVRDEDPVDAKGKARLSLPTRRSRPARATASTSGGSGARPSSVGNASRQRWPPPSPRNDRARAATGDGRPASPASASRLVFELFRGLHAEPDLTTWREGRSLPTAEASPLGARHRQGTGGHPRHRRRSRGPAKLGRGVVDVGAEEGEAEWVERNLRPLVGLGAESEWR